MPLSDRASPCRSSVPQAVAPALTTRNSTQTAPSAVALAGYQRPHRAIRIAGRSGRETCRLGGGLPVSTATTTPWEVSMAVPFRHFRLTAESGDGVHRRVRDALSRTAPRPGIWLGAC